MVAVRVFIYRADGSPVQACYVAINTYNSTFGHWSYGTPAGCLTSDVGRATHFLSPEQTQAFFVCMYGEWSYTSEIFATDVDKEFKLTLGEKPPPAGQPAASPLITALVSLTGFALVLASRKTNR